MCIENQPVTMFRYHVRTCSSVTSGRCRVSSTMSPSEFITRNVGIGGRVDGRKKSKDAVSGLPTAPGNRDLQQALGEYHSSLE